MEPAASAQLLDADLFAHGRLLYRFPGSDVCRFSPKLAWQIIEHIPVGATDRSAVLWDPFCGAGLILAVGCLFFGHRFRTFVASDLSPEAVECSRKNLLLVSQVAAARGRLALLRRMRKIDPNTGRRCDEVAAYLETLLPAITCNERLAPSIQTLVASAFELPPGLERNVHFVGDLPYGRMSALSGGRGVEDLFGSIAAAYPDSTMTFVMSREMAEKALSGARGMAAEITPCRSGRLIVRAAPSCHIGVRS